MLWVILASIIYQRDVIYVLMTRFSTHNANSEKKIWVLKTNRLRKLLLIFHCDHKTSSCGVKKITYRNPFLLPLKKGKFVWSGHVTWYDKLSTKHDVDVSRCQQKYWLTNINDWTDLWPSRAGLILHHTTKDNAVNSVSCWLHPFQALIS